METDGKSIITPEQITLADVLRRLGYLENKVHKLETDAIVQTTELPRDILEESGMLPAPPRTLRRGRGSRGLLISEIIDAKDKCGRNESKCARYLGVSYSTYRRYCHQFQLWEPLRGKWSVKP